MSLRLILLGPPASGKGTQGRRLAAELGLDYLSTGALLREAMEEGSAAGEEARPYLERGDYVPDALMEPLVEDWLERHPQGWVLDGYPRTLAQDDALRAWLGDRELRLDGAIELRVPKEELVRRIEGRVECPECRWSGQRDELNGAGRCPECGGLAGRRADDTLENFLSRHDEFTRHTLPIVERYAAEERLFSCDATAPVEVVAERLHAITERLKSHGQAA
jgi:adenylate kinase